MPRRTWVYDDGQGLELFNMMSSIGAYIQAVSVIIFVWNLWSSRKKGPPAGNNPWGAPTLEGSIPSPPPDYNFAVIPTVTSRYPLWDAKAAPAPEGPMRSAKELGIPMPDPTIKPLFVALWMTFMLASMLLIHLGKTPLAIAGVITFALLMILTLYSWLLTPLEDAH